MRNNIRIALSAVVLLVTLATTSAESLAYGTDVHFNLTYVLSRMAGFSALDARWIAAADESMDHNDSTTAFKSLFDAAKQKIGGEPYWQINGKNFHDFSDEPSSPNPHAKVDERINNLNTRVDNLKFSDEDSGLSRIKYDIALGQYLHFLQDYYAHRVPNSNQLNEHAWQPFGTFGGHALYGHLPDYVAWRPVLAKRMIVRSYDVLSEKAGKLGLSTSAVNRSQLYLLIDNLAAAYPLEGIHYDHNGRPDQKRTIRDIPSQTITNSVLSRSIRSIGYTAIPESLPMFCEAQFNLPYDRPSTSLDLVRQKIENDKTAICR